MKPFPGYRIRQTNLYLVEQILFEARKNLFAAAMAEYHRFLSNEVCELVDDITLGVMQRPDIPILTAAKTRLDDTIARAELSTNGTEYDLRASVSIIPQEDATYLLFNASNPALQKAFAKTRGIEDCTVSEDDVQRGVKTEMAKKWEELRKNSETHPIILNASLANRVELDEKMLQFEEPLVRAKVRARRNMTARLMNQYACGQEIQSAQLMSVMDKALTALTEKETQLEMDDMARQLATTLIKVTHELVLADPKRNFDAAEK